MIISGSGSTLEGDVEATALAEAIVHAYAKKLAMQTLREIANSSDGFSLFELLEFALPEMIETAMQAQREACAQAGFAETFGWAGLEISPQDVIQRRLEVKQAILSAEVKV